MKSTDMDYRPPLSARIARFMLQPVAPWTLWTTLAFGVVVVFALVSICIEHVALVIR